MYFRVINNVNLLYPRHFLLVASRCNAHNIHVTNKDWINKQKRKLKKKLTVEFQETLDKQPKNTKTKPEFPDIEFVGKNKLGEKKDTSSHLPSFYSPEYVESNWYEWWEKDGLFQPKPSNGTYSMVIPPPNVTGNLHLGHALTCAIEDTIVRWQRMLGKEVLWLPGCDHAGMATQVIVERQLAESSEVGLENLNQQEIQSAIWAWKKKNGNEIFQQLRKLGASLDWNKSVFTLDPNYSLAVQHAFIKLHDEGLIYRNKKLQNWCCQLNTSLSDLEVQSQYLEEPISIKFPHLYDHAKFGILFHIAYKLVEPVGDVEEVVITTTRLETIFGDEAIAVNPNDPRYSNLVGKFVLNPLLPHKKLPIIADEAVEMELGTGVLKVSPAHDLTDFEIAQRHDLPITPCFTYDGHMSIKKYNPDPIIAQKLDKIHRFEARDLIDRYLMDIDQFRGCHPHKMILRTCQRSGDVIEPMLTTQWYLRTSEMAKAAKEAVDSNQVEIQEKYHKEWNNWIVNQHDWCISRQISWGHPLPAYKCTDKNTGKSVWVSKQKLIDVKKKAKLELGVKEGDITYEKSSDVLDTWFSSALFPFAALGWPNNTEDYKKFYPLNLMETGHDLIFFWVARMLMLGIHLTGQVPFKKVLFHPMVCDKYGRKMSKSIGNVIDPVTLVDGCLVKNVPRCGSDSLRLALLQNNLESNQIKFRVEDVIPNRKFLNKIYHLFHLLSDIAKDQTYALEKINEKDFDRRNLDKHLCDSSKWIQSEYELAVESVNKALENNNFTVAWSILNKFLVSDFGNTYIEIRKNLPHNINTAENIKYLIVSDRGLAYLLNTFEIFESFLRLFSPFAPFLSEELWQRLPWQLLPGVDRPKSITISQYPQCNDKYKRNKTLEKEMQLVRKYVHGIESKCTQYNLRYCDILLTILCKNEELKDILKKHVTIMANLISCNFQVANMNDISESDQSLNFEVDDEVNLLIELRNPELYVATNKHLLQEQYKNLIEKIEDLEKRPNDQRKRISKIKERAENFKILFNLFEKIEKK